MALTKQPAPASRDPLTLFRQMTSELDRLFETAAVPSLRWPLFRNWRTTEGAWFPHIDMFERDNRLITNVDLPGLRKEDVKVEVADGHLMISGERKSEAEGRKDTVYHCEREYGSFYRAVSLPDGVKLEDVKATFSDGVLEVSVPLPARPDAKVRKVEIEEGSTLVKTPA